MSKQLEVTILPNQPLKTLPISWTITEVLEVPLKLDSSLRLCLIELTPDGQSRHGSNVNLSIAPEWYDLPEGLALGMHDEKTYYLNGTQYGFRFIEHKEIKQCIDINLTSEHLTSIEEHARAFKSTMPNISVRYTDPVLYNAIQENIPR